MTVRIDSVRVQAVEDKLVFSDLRSIAWKKMISLSSVQLFTEVGN